MPRKTRLGGKIRRFRARAKLTQAELARRMEISASYLNLLERDKRPLTVPLLLKLAAIFEVDLSSFAEDDEARLVSELEEVLADPLFAEDHVPSEELRALAREAPAAAQALQRLYRGYRRGLEDVQALAARVTHEHEGSEELVGVDTTRLPSEEVSDMIQAHKNHYATLEAAADRLWAEADLDSADLERGLRLHLEKAHRVRVETLTSGSSEGIVRRFDPGRMVLSLSEVLPRSSRIFQLAHQIGLLTLDEPLKVIVAGAALSTPGSEALARVALANYFASAVLMPYERFLRAAKDNRYDIEILEHRFQASFEQVCHRLTSLNRPGASGVPLHMVRMDIGGNITKRYSGSGIRFARYSGACPRWNVHGAFMTPGQMRIQVSRMLDGTAYFCIARTVRKAGGGYRVPQSRLAIGLGCDLVHAKALVYSDGVDLENDQAAVPIGTTCRLCERMDCRQRAFPPLHHRLEVDENRRGLSFFYLPPERRP